ncbi:MAG: peptidase T [Spirochaetia bacterium]
MPRSKKSDVSHQRELPLQQDMHTDREWFETELLSRFTRYARVFTTSDRHSDTVPSADRELELTRMLETELKELGVEEVELTDEGYLLAAIPANAAGAEDATPIGFMAHVDTSPDSNGENVEPQLHRSYNGGVLQLAGGVVLDPAAHPELKRYHGETIITSDGTTLLGADDKAGIAEIMTAISYMREHPEYPHGPLELIFTPDEEIGRGMDYLPAQRLRSRYCYTIDGGDEGAVEAECFNAYLVSVEFSGHVAHPGKARGTLVNANTMLGAFLSMIPRSETPEATDGRYGFYCPLESSADMGSAHLDLIVRDFEMEELERRIEALREFARAVEVSFPGGTVTVEAREQYRNMRDILNEHPDTVRRARRAIEETGIESRLESIRGGTDGSRLTQMGIPTPNVFTGAQNMHGRNEWIALPAMVRAAKTIVNLAVFWSGAG